MDVILRSAAPLLTSVVLLVSACNGDFLEVQELVGVSVPCGDVDAVEQAFEPRESLYQDVPRRTQYLFDRVVCGGAAQGIHVWVDRDGVGPGVEIATVCGYSIRVSEQLADEYSIADDAAQYEAMVERLRTALCS